MLKVFNQKRVLLLSLMLMVLIYPFLWSEMTVYGSLEEGISTAYRISPEQKPANNEDIDIGYQGTLRVILSPAGAVGAGAQWRIAGHLWRDSGAEALTLDSGLHTIQFNEVPGWKPLKEVRQYIPGGQDLELSFQYLPVDFYPIGEVPPITVHHGETVSFRVNCNSITVEGKVPSYPVPVFNTESKIFSYTPGENDRQVFHVSFHGHDGSGPVVQTVQVQPLARLLPEQHILQYKKPVPNPAGSNYLVVSELKSLDTEFFNQSDTEIHTHTVTIAGKTVLIEEGSPYNTLFEQYSGRRDIRSFTIYAEELVIGSPLHLPQTDVTIYARRLKFEDKNPAEPSAIITTPITIPDRPALTGQDGLDGIQAGSIHVYIDRFSAPPGGHRFILKGGDGQPAGLGQDGANGISVAYRSNWYINAWDGGRPIQNVVTEFCCKTGNVVLWPSGGAVWPTAGTDATAPGKPGNAGDGAVFNGTLDLSTFADVSGGSAGAMAPDAQGGISGTPSPARHVHKLFGGDPEMPDVYEIRETRTLSSGGTDAPAPSAEKLTGDAGLIVIEGPPLAWLRSEFLRPVLLHVKDAYLNGNIDFVQEVLAEYLAVFNALPGEIDGELVQLRGEMENLAHRAGNNLDYFGNPAGWVPMLSFEVNMALYENEIERAIKVLYLTYWLKNTERSREDKINALTFARNRMREEISDFRQRYANTLPLIPGLEVQRANIASQIFMVEQELTVLENALMRQAQYQVAQRAAFRQLCRAASILCKVVPKGQPVLGAIGDGLLMFLNIDTNKPLNSYTEIENPASYFDGITYKQNADSVWAKIEAMGSPDNLDHTNAADWFEQLKDEARKLNNELIPIKDIIQRTQAPKNEVEAELMKIKVSHPAYLQVANRLQELNISKEIFAQQLAEVMQLVTMTANGISQNLLAIDAASVAITENLNQQNHTAMQYVREMERRAWDRLLRYRYYMTKAYEYRFLDECPGENNLENLFTKFAEMISEGGSPLTLADYDILKAAYYDDVDQVIMAIVDQLNQLPPERSRSYGVALTESELRELNERGQVVINLMYRGDSGLSHTEQNIRIVDLQTIEGVLVPKVSGGTLQEVDIEYVHSGLSRLEWGGKNYHFTHLNTNPNNHVPLMWKSTYKALVSVPYWEHHEISEAGQSLVRFLMQRANVGNELIMRYSRPAAWADITIKKSRGAGMRIEHLVFDVKVDYFAKSDQGKSTIAIRVNDGLMPRILIDKHDMNERRDGDGTIHRTYNRNDTVRLTAPLTYGTWEFEGWAQTASSPVTTGNGREVLNYSLPGLTIMSTNPSIDIFMNENKTIYPRYQQTVTGLEPPLVSGTDSPTDNPQPTWMWWSGSGEGAGIFRYGWEEENWFAENVEHTSFAPSGSLPQGTHTLYVQERDDSHNWSSSGSYTITVVQELIIYNLQYTAGTGGSLQYDGSLQEAVLQTVPYGGNGLPVQALPDSWYRFLRWSDGRTDNPRQDIDVTADINITAVFVRTTAIDRRIQDLYE